MKCANCQTPALYVYDPPGLSATPYCGEHLPSFLRGHAKAGVLTKTEAFEEAKSAALAALAPEPQPEPAPEAVEQPSESAEDAEEPAEEAPAPRRRRTKKAETPEES